MEEAADLGIDDHSHKRSDPEKASEEVGDDGGDAKRPREGDDDHPGAMEMDEDDGEDEGPHNPFAEDAHYRNNWIGMFGQRGKFEDPTRRPTMRNTDGPMLPMYYEPTDTLEVFYVKVTRLAGGLQWPVDVYGDVAVRDSLDQMRNYLFRRGRDDCQTLTSPQDSSLELTGPSRAVLLWDDTPFEIDLKVKAPGSTSPSEDKVLCCYLYGYHRYGYKGKTSIAKTEVIASETSTVEFKFGHLRVSQEATITARLVDGSGNFRARLTAKTASLGEEVVLLDTRGRALQPFVGEDGAVALRRHVVVVEEHGKLILSVEGAELGGAGAEESSDAVDTWTFVARAALRSEGYLRVGSSRLHMVIAWSLLP
ncbi:hypothetical protein ACP4OV_003156 [Aristida adscensionis]